MATESGIEVIYERGFNFRCNGQYAEARTELSLVLQQAPRPVNARHQLALIQGFEGDFDGSIASLQGLFNENPTNLEIRYDLAMTQMMLGMYEEACAHFKAILEVSPGHEKAKNQATYC